MSSLLALVGLMRTLYIVLSRSRFQEQIIEMGSEPQPLLDSTTSELLSQGRKSVQGAWDKVLTIITRRSSSSSEDKETIARQGEEILELRNAIQDLSSKSHIEKNEPLNIQDNVISRQAKEIAELKTMIRCFSEKLNTLATSQADECDRLAA
ncbi:hypothetical protein VKT23_008627 [Stygiomarasmius scandens]|uniref:Uncharacterized protein n=1 Tax=Marasmiellus scandens TaxID=2682957 RepID=A0ABR1JGZ3_9AGAR